MRVYETVGFLNSNTFFFGLGTMDLVALSSLLICLQKLGFESLHKGAPFFMTLLATGLLVPIRLRCPKRTIRGFITFWGKHVAFKIVFGTR